MSNPSLHLPNGELRFGAKKFFVEIEHIAGDSYKVMIDFGWIRKSVLVTAGRVFNGIERRVLEAVRDRAYGEWGADWGLHVDYGDVGMIVGEVMRELRAAGLMGDEC